MTATKTFRWLIDILTNGEVEANAETRPYKYVLDDCEPDAVQRQRYICKIQQCPHYAQRAISQDENFSERQSVRLWNINGVFIVVNS